MSQIKGINNNNNNNDYNNDNNNKQVCYMFKCNNRGNKTTLMILLWCLCYKV